MSRERFAIVHELVHRAVESGDFPTAAYAAGCREQVLVRGVCGDAPPDKTDIAPTEWDPSNGRLICGTVHDENARFLKGISANAGVFSDLDDMIRFAVMLACGGSQADGSAFLSPAMYCLATTNHTPGKSEHRGPGFQLAGEGSFMGDLFPASSFGHTGFTGTSLAVHPSSGLYVVLLTNRVNPTRDNLAIIRFRKTFHNAIFAAFSRNDQSCG